MQHQQQRGVARRTILIASLSTLVAISAAVAVGQDSRKTTKAQASGPWPQWRGPQRDGKCIETGLLKQWPENGPKPVWKAQKLGTGFSTVSIADGKIFSMGDAKGDCYVWALREADGKPLWSQKVGKSSNHGGYPGTRSTPTYADGMVYTLTPDGDVVCLDANKGTPKWGKSLTKEFGGQVPGWGYAESVIVDGDRVVCTPGGDKGTMLALDRKTGKKLWQSVEWKDGAHYVSAIVAEIDGVRQYIQLTAESVAGIEAESGRVLWRNDRKGETAVIPSPVFHDNHVFVTSGYGVGCDLFKVTPKGSGAFAVERVYQNKDMVNHHGGVVLVGEHLYGHSDNGGMTCMEFMTGKVVWQDRSVGKGATLFADGMLMLRSEGGEGSVALFQATPDGYKETGVFDQPDRSGANSWPHPVIANGKLYLRDQEILLCYDVKAK